MTIEQYWDSTIKDINIYINLYNDKQKEKLRDRYETSQLISYFVNLGLNGKEIPDITDIYPDVFETDKDSISTIKQYEKQFAMLAADVNASRKGK